MVLLTSFVRLFFAGNILLLYYPPQTDFRAHFILVFANEVKNPFDHHRTDNVAHRTI